MPAMTDPTRDEVEATRFAPYSDAPSGDGWMDHHPHGEWVRFTDYQALRERAEAAEEDKLKLAQQFDKYHPDPALMSRIILNGYEHEFRAEQAEAKVAALTARLDAAWNDAIEAAAKFEHPREVTIWGKGAYKEVRASIRALRRAAPAEDR